MEKPRPSIDLITILREVPDPRVERRRLHKLEDILVIAVCAILCGAESFEDMEYFGECREGWLRRFLELANGIPSHDTFNRVFQAIDTQRFLEAFMGWTAGVRAAVGEEVVALDGKALRRALDRGQTAKVVVGAWAAGNGLLLGQRMVEDKSNEITALPPLLEALDIRGCIVTADAMGCQKQVAAMVEDAGAHYVLALKGNQGNAHAEVVAFLDDAVARGDQGLDCHEEHDKGHGRVETRRCWQSTDIGWFEDREVWPGLASVAVVEARRTTTEGATSVERRYYLSSLPAGAARLAGAVRSHWSIENSCHWVLDVVFGEDQSRARTRHAAANLATLRRWCLNLLKADTTLGRRSIKGRRKNAAWDERYLLHVLGINLNA